MDNLVIGRSSASPPLAAAAARTFSCGKFIYVGREKYYVKGVAYGAFEPDENGQEYHDLEQIDRDFEQMAAAGINTVRIPHTMPPRALLDVAWRHGLRVMVGLSAEQYVGYLIDREKKAPDIERIVREKVRTVAGHPALLCYAIGNEIPASIARWLGSRRLEGYLRRFYIAIKREDPGAIVTYVNYPSTEYLDLPFLDVLCFNVYLESRDRLAAYIARLQNIAGDRPLIMSEVGLDALRNGEQKQAEVLDWQVRTCFAAGCAGVVIFSWTDEWFRAGAEVEDWAFGLTDRKRGPKPSLDAVIKAFEESPFAPREDWPRISVVVCTCNGAPTLRDCLGGLSRLDYPDFEVIVVNDGSSDETPQIASDYNCKLISIENGGLSNARNVGLKAATGEIVAYLDDDAIPDRHWLKYLAAAFRDSSHAGIGGPNIPPRNPGIVADCVANAPGQPVHVLLTDELAEHIPGCNMAFRKSALEEIGGCDPQFWVAGDDVDLCWRIEQRGWALGYCPAAMVWHHRRRTIADYWRQQIGYGKAEALLESKWREKYNSVGHPTFAGRLYGKGIVHALFRRALIYHGAGGFAPFQSLYERQPGTLLSVPMMPEWYLLIALLGGFGALGALWTPLLFILLLAILALGLSLTNAAIRAAQASFQTPCHSFLRSIQLRGLTAYLHLLQPIARLFGRAGNGLILWRQVGSRDFAWPRLRSSAIWTETWIAPEQRLEAVCLKLRENRELFVRGGDFDRWDVEVKGGVFGGGRMMMAVEDHGAGTQFVRVKIWPTIRRSAVGVIPLFGTFSAFAAYTGQWMVGVITGLLFLLAVLRTVQECGCATAGISKAVQSTELGGHGL